MTLLDVCDNINGLRGGEGAKPLVGPLLIVIQILCFWNKIISIFNSTVFFAGLYLHRLWQLGLEKEYYEEGVRPHLAVFYETIRARPAFVKITGWREQAGERSVRTQEDDLVQNARWGLGAAAVLGKFCTLCWLKHRPSVFFSQSKLC